MAAKRKATGLHWELSGPCPTCAAPVFFAFKGKEIHVRRTCYHNLNQQYGSGYQPPYQVWPTGNAAISPMITYTSGTSVNSDTCTSAITDYQLKAVSNG